MSIPKGARTLVLIGVQGGRRRCLGIYPVETGARWKEKVQRALAHHRHAGACTYVTCEWF